MEKVQFELIRASENLLFHTLYEEQSGGWILQCAENPCIRARYRIDEDIISVLTAVCIS